MAKEKTLKGLAEDFKKTTRPVIIGRSRKNKCNVIKGYKGAEKTMYNSRR